VKLLLRLVAVLLAGSLIPACISSGPRISSTYAPNGPVVLKAARLSGRQQVPALISDAHGDATVVIDPSLTSFKVTLTFEGLTDITEAHIHVGEPGVNGPIIFPLAAGSFTSPFELTVTEALLRPQPDQGVNTFIDALNAMAGGHTYANIHTNRFKDGEIRGQIGPARVHAQLDGRQQVPPVASSGSGFLSLTMNNDQTEMTFTLSVTGLNNVTMAHIHPGEPGVNGPIMIPFSEVPFASPLSGTLTEADFIPPGLPGFLTFTETVDSILGGFTYANVHTLQFPNGEIRGQIMGVIPAPTPPPTTTPPTGVPPPPSTTPPTIIIGPY